MAKIIYNMSRLSAEKTIDYSLNHLEKDLPKALTNISKFSQHVLGDTYDKSVYQQIGNIINDPDSKWMKFISNILEDTDRNVVRNQLLNVGYQAGFYGAKMRDKNIAKYNMNIPWIILFDPTSACNLHCTGCWAAEYGHKLNLTFEEMDRIVTQGKEIGVYLYFVTGGEPTVRMKDLIRLAKKHSDCAFHMYTNGTLLTDEICEEVKKIGTITFAISLEGFEKETDTRRGEGAFKNVLKSMDLMKKHGLLFGVSACYTSQNYLSVTSDEFLDLIIEHGAKMIWYFHYMPVGKDASPDLLLNSEQRAYMVKRVRYIRSSECDKLIYSIDFQNDGQYINGCIAGGKNYMHINANGDVEPCVFIHYSSANIRNMSIMEALQQPLFKAYRAHQPFNKNHLRPCPMLENPAILKQMVESSGAKSTDLQTPETVDELCKKCTPYAKEWQPEADKLWNNILEAKNKQ